MPKLSLLATPIQSARGDVIIVPIDTNLDIAEFFSASISRAVQILMKRVQFQGQWGRAEVFVAPNGLHVPFIAFVGMGSTDISVARRAEGIRRGVASVIVDGRIHL